LYFSNLVFCYLQGIPYLFKHIGSQNNKFVETRSWDDTSRALVHYYFSRNIKVKRGVGIFTGVGLLSAFAFDRILLGDSRGGGSALGALIIGIPLALLIY